MADRVIYLEGRGARGMSFAEQLRGNTYDGVFYPESATDEEIYQLFSGNDTLTAAVEGFSNAAGQSAAVAAAFVNGLIYPDVASGLAAVSSGDYFAVATSGNISIYRDNAGAAQFITSLYRNDFAYLEQFGVPGAAANDNALLTAAIATGKPIKGFGTLYKFDQFLATSPVDIEFGPQTEVRNVQAGGAKKAAITVAGGYAGAAVNVTGFDLDGGGTVASIKVGQLSRIVRVADASGFAVGDMIRLYEDGPFTAATRKGTPSAEMEDANYRQFVTIIAKAGNVLTLQEYLAWPFTVSIGPMKARKVNFVERPVIRGGRWTGGNPAGGAIEYQFVRYGYAGDLICIGNGQDESLNMGGAPVTFRNCLESERGPVSARWTTFAHLSEYNQACQFGPIVAAKKTTNGGVIIGGDILCHFAMITQDAVGDDNGDQITISNGARGNHFAGLVGSGSNCYTIWLRQFCDDNVFGSVVSIAGETIAVQDFGNRNVWKHIKVRGHPSNGCLFAGDDTQAQVDIVVQGTAVLLQGPQRGLRIAGRAVSLDATDPNLRDLTIGELLRDSVIDLQGGTEGAGYAAGAVEHHSNEIILSGPNPYVLRGRRFLGGEPHRSLLVNIPSNPGSGAGVIVKVPGYRLISGVPQDTTDGLMNLNPIAADDGVVYEITLTRNQGYPGTYSKYIVLTRQGDFTIVKEELGTPGGGATADFIPKLRAIATNPPRLEVFVGAGSPVAQAIMEVRKI